MAKTIAKPFLKWAGGKTQLLEELTNRLPVDIGNGGITSFIEPFIGGGAVFFHLNSLHSFRECHIFDSNPELVLAYTVLRDDPEDLIDCLASMAGEYLSLDESGRSDYYYDIRDRFNKGREAISFWRYSKEWIPRAAELIFMNRTCYNGLFRVNSKGGFNVPFGRYKNPKILNSDLLRTDSGVLSNTKIHPGDFADSLRYVREDSFVYFDPPYRPLNSTSSFTSYSSGGFDDESQRRLADFFKKCDKKGAKIMLSNSDPKNVDPEDDFFDDLYGDFRIERVPAKRMINSDAGKRGEVSEILVMNF
ncbi:MAG: DNA adenine methylase [Methanomicrobiaceae archaeon]|nr:DNA adenine methylase [Methanomicrobiaceae archaeon]